MNASPTSNSKTISSDAARWNDFVAAAAVDGVLVGDILQCLEWGEVKKPDWQPIPISVERDGVLRAVALVLKRKMPYSDRSIFYVSRGPILDWNDADLVRELFAKIRDEARRHKAAFIKIDPAIPRDAPSTPGIETTLRAIGFLPSPESQSSFGGTQPRCVMKMDISAPTEKVPEQFHQKWRYNLRLGERKGLTVKSDCTREDLKIFHELYLVTASRDGFKGYPFSYFEKLWDTLFAKDLAKLFLVYHDDKPLSGAISFVLPPQCWYVFGASGNEGRNLMPNHAMQWAMMKWAKERGCTIYDFRGVHDVRKDPDFTGNLMDSSDGLVRFKAGFGAQLTEYFGEWDWPLDKKWYWAWTKARPALAQAAKKVRGRK